MPQNLHWYDYITVNIYWFAIAVRSQVMTPLVIPLLVSQLVGDAEKGTYYGSLRLGGLMIALLAQTTVGTFSDHYSGRFGRRRIFIVLGTLGELAALWGMGVILGLTGVGNFWILFLIYLFSMISSNTAQAGVNGLIPDLVPDSKKSSFSVVKALFDLPISLVFFSFILSRVVSSGHIESALAILAGVNGVCVIVTLFAREKPGMITTKVEWKPVLLLAGMVFVFTLIILGTGELVQRLNGLANIYLNQLALPVVLLISVMGIGGAIFASVHFGLKISLGAAADHNTEYKRWVLNRMAFLTGTNNLGGFMIYYLQSRFTELHGVQAAQPVMGLMIVTGLCILLSTLPAGWLSDKYGKKQVIIASTLLVFAGVVILVSAGTLVVMALGAGLIGSGTGLFFTANWSLGTTLVPKNQAGLYLGLSNIASAGAGAIGAYIGGPIGDHYGYSLLMIIYGVIVLFSGLAFLDVKPSLQVKLADA